MGSYSVLIEARGDDDQVVTHEAIDVFATVLFAHAGTVSGAPGYRSWSAMISVDTPNAVTAAVAAESLISKAAYDAGLPDWPVVRAEAVREDVLDEDLARPQLPDLVTAPEAAEILGVTRQRVHALAAENADFPWAIMIGSIRVWHRAAIERFNGHWDRKGGWPKGRPRKAG
jgi:predicted DNA-binding transcriptional regulator AlpA